MPERTPPNAAERTRWNDDQWIATWLQREPVTASAMPMLLDALDLRSGEHMLDIGCGSAAGTIECARVVGARGHVTGVDISDSLVRLGRDRVREANVDNVALVVADAQVDTFPDQPFDVAGSKFGVMFFDDPLAAFGNIGRQLKTDGRLAFVCFQSADRNPWHTAALLLSFAPPAPPLPPGTTRPGPFSLGDAAATTALLEDAGFGTVGHTDVEITVRGPTSFVYDESQLTTFGIPPERRAEAAAAMDAHIAQFAAGDGEYAFPLALRTWTARVT